MMSEPLIDPDTKTPEVDEFVSDREIARRWHVGLRTAQIAICAFEKNPSFPRRDPLFGGRRYWPAVVAFMRQRAGLIQAKGRRKGRIVLGDFG